MSLRLLLAKLIARAADVPAGVLDVDPPDPHEVAPQLDPPVRLDRLRAACCGGRGAFSQILIMVFLFIWGERGKEWELHGGSLFSSAGERVLNRKVGSGRK